jgi:septum formation protein
VRFEVREPDIEEADAGEPAQAALANAACKARAVPSRAGETVLGCDTMVVLDGEIYGKPADEDAARATLQRLSGRAHEVLSGLVLLEEERERSAVARTRVDFRELTPALLDWYLTLGEWRGRAGAYAIQGAGAALVRAVEGDYENVVGLPVAALLDLHPQLLEG